MTFHDPSSPAEGVADIDQAGRVSSITTLFEQASGPTMLLAQPIAAWEFAVGCYMGTRWQPGTAEYRARGGAHCA